MYKRNETFKIEFMVLSALVGIAYGVITNNLTTALVSGMVIGLAIDLIVYYKNKKGGE